MLELLRIVNRVYVVVLEYSLRGGSLRSCEMGDGGEGDGGYLFLDWNLIGNIYSSWK